ALSQPRLRQAKLRQSSGSKLKWVLALVSWRELFWVRYSFSRLIHSTFTKDASFMRKLFFGFILLLAATVAASAAPGGAVRCGKLLDVRTGQVLSDQVVTFDADGIIVSVLPASPAVVSMIDLSKGTCLPGLIDVHPPVSGDPGDTGYRGLGISVPREAVTGVKNARLTLHAGFTTIRNVGAGN